MFLPEELCETTAMLFKEIQNKDLPLLSKSMDFSCFLSEMCRHWAGLCNLPASGKGSLHRHNCYPQYPKKYNP